MELEHLLQNSAPKYYLSRGRRCYLAVDNAHGGATIPAEIVRRTTLDGKDAYDVTYTEPDCPTHKSQVTVPVAVTFTSLEDMAMARKRDYSLQLKSIADACSNAANIIAFLLSRSELSANEQEVVLRKARELKLYPETPENKKESEEIYAAV